MGRTPHVAQNELIKLIEKYIEKFVTNNFPPNGDELWKQMSRDLHGRLKPSSIYTHVRYDKRGDLTQARRNKGIELPVESKTLFMEDITKSYEDDVDLDNEDLGDDYIPETTGDQPPFQTFPLLLTNEEWSLLKPEENGRRLKKNSWANVITNAFWKRYNFSCAFLARWSYVNPNFNSQEDGIFLKFHAYCKDTKNCKNTMIGTATHGPTEKGLELVVKTIDTRDNYHIEVLRPLNGVERKQVGATLQKQSAANYRDELLGKNVKFGENIPPFVRKKHVYRQARMEANKENMGLKPSEKMDVIKILQSLSSNSRYRMAIHNLGGIRFYIFYSTMEQIFVFQEYVRVMKQLSQISIDATGKVVKAFEICPGRITGHIFLYTVTIKFQGQTMCVYQMLSEIHTTEFIESWLKLWLRLGASAPGEALSDYARAIPMACSLAFNNMSLKEYVDTCYLWLIGGKKKKRPVATIIRIDVAHLMHLVALWKCLKDKDNPFLKDFLLRCVALMIDSTDISRFSHIFRLTCIITLHHFENTVISFDGTQMTVLDAQMKLEEYIGRRRDAIQNLEESRKVYSEEKGDDIPPFEEGENETITHQWIKKLIASAQPCDSDIRGTKINAFYLPEFVKQLERVAKEFVLWTDVISTSGKHASTAHQEGYYAYLRNKIFEFVTLPCSVNRFVIEHLRNLESGSNLLAAQLKHATHQRLPGHKIEREENNNGTLDNNENTPEPPQKKIHLINDSDLLTQEQWRGLKNARIFDAENETSDDEEEQTGKGNEQLNESSTYNTSSLFSAHRDENENMNSINETVVISKKENIPKLDTTFITHDNFDRKTSTNDRINYQQNDLDVHFDNHEKETTSTSRELHVSNSKLSETISKGPKFTSTPLADHSYANFMDEDNEQLFETISNSNKTPNSKNPVDVSLINIPDESYAPSQSDNSFSNEKPIQPSTAEKNESMPHQELHKGVKDDIIFLVPDSSVDDTQPQDEMSQNAPEKKAEKSVTRVDGEKKTKNIEKVKKPSFYFRPYPEIKILNQRKTSRKRGFLLPNGSVSGLLKIKCTEPFWKFKDIEKKETQTAVMRVRVINTCGFDALVQIIQFSILDNPTYQSYLKQSDNETFKFILNFTEKGITKDIYFKRLKILNQFFPITKGNKSTSLSPYYLDAESFAIALWQKYFSSEPSAYTTSECSNKDCPRTGIRKVLSLPVNEKIIKQKGYGALDRAILYYPRVDNIKCRQSQCSGTVTENTTLNIHICIELDIRLTRDKEKTMECCLKDFPLSLTLGRKYRLAGLVHYDPNDEHFTAYCLRTSGCWICCDDILDKISSCKEIDLVRPQCIIYVLE